MVLSKVANTEPSAWNARNNLTCIDFGLVFWLAEKVTRYFLANQWLCMCWTKQIDICVSGFQWLKTALARFTQPWSPSLQLQVRKIWRCSDWDKEKTIGKQAKNYHSIFISPDNYSRWQWESQECHFFSHTRQKAAWVLSLERGILVSVTFRNGVKRHESWKINK